MNQGGTNPPSGGWSRATATVLTRLLRQGKISSILMRLPCEAYSIQDVALHSQFLPRVSSLALSRTEGADQPASNPGVPVVREERFALQAHVQCWLMRFAEQGTKQLPTQVREPTVRPVRTQLVERKVQTRDVQLLPRSATIRDAVDGLDLEETAIRCGTKKMGRIPHARRCAHSANSASRDPGLYLGEREKKLGILPDDCEVVAVFQKVPVEMIARLRFMEDHQLALYTLIPHSGRSVTRVTDIAVLRQKGRSRLHYMVHRTLFHHAELDPE